ncbi:MAG: hypothetical protein H6765_07630 [Candidatus Peribacteria bacterium]|nr:MAG: hypothetical protein H6765_07630 [Candidatus Peribacteria bacterium]
MPKAFVGSANNAAKDLQQLLLKYGYFVDVDRIRALLEPQEIRYVRLLTDMNAKIAKLIKDAKVEYFNETVRGVPLLHGL